MATNREKTRIVLSNLGSIPPTFSRETKPITATPTARTIRTYSSRRSPSTSSVAARIASLTEETSPIMTTQNTTTTTKKTTTTIAKSTTTTTSIAKKPENVLRKIQRREVVGKLTVADNSLSDRKKGKLFFESVPKRLLIPISHLIDPERELMNCMILGFTKDGNFLVSYHAREVDDDHDPSTWSSGGNVVYSLQWWRFRGPAHRLEKQYEVTLFGDREGECWVSRRSTPAPLWHHLEITVAETVEEEVFVVHGRVNGETDATSRQFFSVIPSPIIHFSTTARCSTRPEKVKAVHFSFIGEDRPFVAGLALSSTWGCGLLVLHFGSSLRFVKYVVQGQPGAEEEKGRHGDTVSESFKFIQKKDTPLPVFWNTSLQAISITRPSLVRSLHDVNNQKENHRPPSLFEQPTKKLRVDEEGTVECKIVSEVSFEAEAYLVQLIYGLPDATSKHLTLVDYDLQVVSLDNNIDCERRKDGTVSILITALLLERARTTITTSVGSLNNNNNSNNNNTTTSNLIGFLISLNLVTGEVESTVIEKTEVREEEGRTEEQVTRMLTARGSENSLRLRRDCTRQTWGNQRVSSWSNTNAIKGISLPYLHHPTLPIAIAGFQKNQ